MQLKLKNNEIQDLRNECIRIGRHCENCQMQMQCQVIDSFCRIYKSRPPKDWDGFDVTSVQQIITRTNKRQDEDVKNFIME